jgi:hypothetical protein
MKNTSIYDGIAKSPKNSISMTLSQNIRLVLMQYSKDSCIRRNDSQRLFAILSIYIICLIAAISNAFASGGTAGDRAEYESRYIVDMPTAGMLPQSAFSLYGMAYSDGGILAEIFACPFKDFLIGISFGGTGIIGESDVNFQELPSVHIRYRVINEKLSFPAIVFGVNTQGRGIYSKSRKQFEVFSPGIYLSLSKNFNWLLGDVAFHGGANYSFEAKPETRVPNLYCGLEQSIGSSVAFNFEFNTAINEYREELIEGIGIFNASLRWSVAAGMTLEFQLRDLLSNRKNYNTPSRYIGLEYIDSF